jgi:hypothetical protein
MPSEEKKETPAATLKKAFGKVRKVLPEALAHVYQVYIKAIAVAIQQEQREDATYDPTTCFTLKMMEGFEDNVRPYACAHRVFFCLCVYLNISLQ